MNYIKEQKQSSEDTSKLIEKFILRGTVIESIQNDRFLIGSLSAKKMKLDPPNIEPSNYIDLYYLGRDLFYIAISLPVLRRNGFDLSLCYYTNRG